MWYVRRLWTLSERWAPGWPRAWSHATGAPSWDAMLGQPGYRDTFGKVEPVTMLNTAPPAGPLDLYRVAEVLVYDAGAWRRLGALARVLRQPTVATAGPWGAAG